MPGQNAIGHSPSLAPLLSQEGQDLNTCSLAFNMRSLAFNTCSLIFVPLKEIANVIPGPERLFLPLKSKS